MNETGLWRYVNRGMHGFWHATRIESSAGNGVPDISFGVSSPEGGLGLNGFIELKFIKDWPKREDTPLVLPLRPEQKLWIETRGSIAGNVWVLCRVENDFFLFNDKQALEASRGRIQRWWFGQNFLYCCRQLDFRALVKILREGY